MLEKDPNTTTCQATFRTGLKTYLYTQAFQLHLSIHEKWNQRLGIFALFPGHVTFDVKRSPLENNLHQKLHSQLNSNRRTEKTMIIIDP